MVAGTKKEKEKEEKKKKILYNEVGERLLFDLLFECIAITRRHACLHFFHSTCICTFSFSFLRLYVHKKAKVNITQ